MSNKINMKEIERKVYTSYHQDGLIDITIAFVILAFAILIVLDQPGLGGVWGVTAFAVYAGAKKTITVPRIGYVKFPQVRARRVNMGLLFLGALGFALGMIVFVQTVSEGVPSWLQLLIDNYMLTLGLLGSALFLMAGYAIRTNRMYAYAMLTLVMFAVGHLIQFPIYYYLTVLGTVILMCGLFLMVRFIRKYPKTPQTAEA